MYLAVLIMNYFLTALHGFSLSYSKKFPGVSCLKDSWAFLLLLSAVFFLFRRGKWYLQLLVTCHFIILLLLTMVYLTTGTFFCESILCLVYDTTWEETKGFFSAYVRFWHILLFAGIIGGYTAGMYFAGKLCCRKAHSLRSDIIAAVTVLLITFLPLATSGEKAWKSHPFYTIYRQIGLFNEHAGVFVREMRHRNIPEFVRLAPELASAPPLGVLVIGESAIRSHHSIYGYQRDTTPQLCKRQPEIIVFDDVITVLPMTITALKYFLTDMTLENRHVSWTVFDALKAVGYQVDVITNQNKSGWADSPLQMIFGTADSITYMHEENFSDLAEDRNAKVYDAVLLPHFTRFLRDKSGRCGTPQLAVLHLFGSHEPYASRYPADFYRQFLNDTAYSPLVNEYDTSLRYTDMILGKILAELEKLDRPAYLIYVADNGALRSPNSVENSAYEIPFLLWSNRRYRELYPELFLRMEKSRHVPLQSDRAHFGLLEMMGVTFTADVSKENFLSENFSAVPRTVREGTMPYVRDNAMGDADE